jgi:hypothetical protein
VLSANLGELATKQDLKELEMRLDARFEALRGEFDVRFAALTGELDARFAALKGEQTLLKWMLGLLLGGVVALVRPFSLGAALAFAAGAALSQPA